MFHALPAKVPVIEPENAEQIVLPRSTTPARRSRATTVASRSAMLPANAGLPSWAASPLMPTESLMPIGMPHR